MKITKTQLKKIINEEFDKLNEIESTEGQRTPEEAEVPVLGGGGVMKIRQLRDEMNSRIKKAAASEDPLQFLLTGGGFESRVQTLRNHGALFKPEEENL
jgi:hypothetical protein